MTRCPSCSIQIDLNTIDLEQGVARCPACNHGWLEAKPVEPIRSAILTTDQTELPDQEIRQLLSASLLAQEAFQQRRKRRRAAIAAWLGLALFAASPAAIALTLPDKVVAAAPATISFYDWLGKEVNIYGLEIRKVELQHLIVNSQKVIAIKGELQNVSSEERKIPWLRFGLKSGDNQELYQWQLDTASRPLRPGEAKSFVTRVASPPEAASTVEIRFARPDEIGSNASP
jgi:Zn-finger nucleic acid-binding protein